MSIPQRKNHRYGKSYHKSIPIPTWIEKLTEQPWTSASSLTLDRWFWYEQQEFEVKGGDHK